jgi:hypothetical protein
MSLKGQRERGALRGSTKSKESKRKEIYATLVEFQSLVSCLLREEWTF